ncbi:MAG: AMP-binding protein [Myxococcales bacterium]|nr:AMP-binding protein [Myxococcales bacterium]
MKTLDIAATLAEAILNNSERDSPGFTFVDGRASAQDVTWRQQGMSVLALAATLHRIGLAKGDRVALTLKDPHDFVDVFLACVVRGILPVPLAPAPTFGDAQTYMEHLRLMLSAAECSHLITASDEASSLVSFGASSPGFPRVIAVSWLRENRTRADDSMPTIGPHDPCFIQFSSGSTYSPKGVVISHRNLVSNCRATHERLDSDPEADVGVNWLPLYHDMGLIGSVVTPTLSAGRQVLIPTQAFAARPGIWLKAVHDHGGTISATNNFGLRAATKRPPRVERLDLRRLRAVIVGGEQVNHTTVSSFVHRFASSGLRAEALCAAYGLAEATLCVASQSPRARPRVVRVDPNRNHLGAVEPTSRSAGHPVVGCGSALKGHQITIRDQAGGLLKENEIGEIWVQGPSVTAGYWGSGGVREHPLSGGWLRTGDLGFLNGEAELFVVGRVKEIVIVAGRNYAPHGIEHEVERIEGVRPERVAAFSVGSVQGDELVVAFECRNPTKVDGLARKVRMTLATRLGLRPREVIVMPPWTLPMTTSGKVQRLKTKAAYDAGLLPRLNTIEAQ